MSEMPHRILKCTQKYNPWQTNVQGNYCGFGTSNSFLHTVTTGCSAHWIVHDIIVCMWICCIWFYRSTHICSFVHSFLFGRLIDTRLH